MAKCGPKPQTGPKPIAVKQGRQKPKPLLTTVSRPSYKGTKSR